MADLLAHAWLVIHNCQDQFTVEFYRFYWLLKGRWQSLMKSVKHFTCLRGWRLVYISTRVDKSLMSEIYHLPQTKEWTCVLLCTRLLFTNYISNSNCSMYTSWFWFIMRSFIFRRRCECWILTEGCFSATVTQSFCVEQHWVVKSNRHSEILNRRWIMMRVI